MSFVDKIGLGKDKSIVLFIQTVILVIALICSVDLLLNQSVFSLKFAAELCGLLVSIFLLVYAFVSRNKNYYLLSLIFYAIAVIIWLLYDFYSGNVIVWLEFLYLFILICLIASMYTFYKDSKYTGYLLIAVFIFELIMEILFILQGDSILRCCLFLMMPLSVLLTYYLR